MRNASRSSGGDPSALRFAEIYAKALDRLVDPRPAQRIGAMHTLEVLAQESPVHLQAVVDIFCAVLRAHAVEDGPARAAVQRMLAQHLHSNAGPAHWSGASIDLTGAVLIDLDLTGCRVDGNLILDRAVLYGQTRMREMVVRGTASMHAVTFCDHTWLERSVFYGPFCADAAVFRGDTWLGEAGFCSRVSLQAAEFAGHAWLGNAVFRGRLDLSDAVFRRSAGFRGAAFYDGVSLAGTTFLGPARVSMRGDVWNVAAPGWQVVVDPDNAAVGQLLWVGNAALIEPSPV